MRRVGFPGVVVLALVATGCAPHVVGFSPIGALTLRVAPDRDADAVWLLKTEGNTNEAVQTILRCHNTEQGPVCVAAKVSQ